MKLVVLGLSLSSSWGNGHATTYRALLKAFAARGHDILFLERDVPWYARQPRPRRPGLLPAGTSIARSRSCERWRDEIAQRRRGDRRLLRAGRRRGRRAACSAHARGVTAFYDIDTPVTLAKLERRRLRISLARADPRLRPLSLVHRRADAASASSGDYGSPTARALYCSVDPDAYPAARRAEAMGPDLSRHLQRRPAADARAAADRAGAPRCPHLQVLRRRPAISRRHRLAGQRRADRPSAAGRPRGFYAASRFTLNVTRADMIAAGWSPSVRLFEAAACGTPIISDSWDGHRQPVRARTARSSSPRRSDEVVGRSTSGRRCVARSAAPRARVLAAPHRRAPRRASWSAHSKKPRAAKARRRAARGSVAVKHQEPEDCARRRRRRLHRLAPVRAPARAKARR